ncbi:hypothetical protein BVRB_8g193830 [Beta vulgaris subsp. vulgaris]|uniref:calmodulin-like protein 7 n=1 Tax=Beta vulgaris subsp. vulgaris TaxID=3555 RepID=UPI00053FAF39|nr:calmodulin-like protein 7 [Beta vulgaris subsp. vulgaris]KMT02799.1 hypothetical protein BVRB_8g193830 [Beta vulgaris subsp. vulgaris]
MIIPILILVSSIFFISGFLNLKLFNSTKNFLLHIKKPILSSPASPLQPISSPKKNHTIHLISKDDDLKRVFDSFDKNGDGSITKEELKESLNNMGILVPLKDIEEMVENLDSNKDGLVDLSEFRELYELLKGIEEKKNEEGKKVGDFDDEEEDLKEAFSVFDGNKDGLITVEELKLVLSSLGLKEGNKEEDCKEMIKKVDVDGDGMVNYDEFKMMMRARCSNASSRFCA